MDELIRRRAIARLACLLLTIGPARAETAPYPAMATRDQYLIAERSAEIALARSAAPPSISNDAEVLVLGAHGFETAARGTNSFVCLVERAWDKSWDDPEFWNPKMRAPICMNAAAAHTVLPMYLERAKWALSGLTLDEMRRRSVTSASANQAPAAGAMSYMMSKQQYLSDGDGHWHPHVMIFSPPIDLGDWGANLGGSPVLGGVNSSKITVLFILVRKWSDGTLAESDAMAASEAHHHH